MTDRELDRRDLLRKGVQLGAAGSIAGALSTGTAEAAPNTVLNQHQVNLDRVRNQGTAYRFIQMNWGTSHENSSGAVNKVAHGAGYQLDHGSGRAERATIAAAADVGWGNWSASAAVGTEFQTRGNRPVDVTVEAFGQYNGLLTAFLSASSSASARLVLKNMKTGKVNRQPLFSAGYGRVGYDRIKDTYEEEFNTRLTPGHRYRMYAEIDGRISITGLGEAGCDFGPEDHDDKLSGGPNGVILEDFGLWPRSRR